ncbi:MAG: hypothetical protein HYT37_01545 [Candidatus Sungbacteria bacterium]|nr:hypothetical protein [Candidatus Sungbacteria bacterium]
MAEIEYDSYLRGYNPDMQVLRLMLLQWMRQESSKKYNTSFSTFYSHLKDDLRQILHVLGFPTDYLTSFERHLLDIFHEAYHMCDELKNEKLV